MPNRILREGILTSPRMAKLGWAEEVFYRRLMSVVDDFGRYYADPGMLRAACYPRQLNKVSDSDVGKWLQGIADAALVRVYPAEDGERYLEVIGFGQQIRAKKSKFPDAMSTCAADAQQEPANAHLDVSVSVSVVDRSAPDGALFDRFYKAYPKKKAPDDARKAFNKRKPDEAMLQAMLTAIEAQKATDDWLKDGGKYIPYPATWLNDGRWMDEVAVSSSAPASAAANDTQLYLEQQRQHEAAVAAQTEEQKAAIREQLRLARAAVTRKEAA